jgi:hypothetical protein
VTYTCKSCPFLGEDVKRPHVCRRHAPVPAESVDDVEPYWPSVDPDKDWCGEHPMLASARAQVVWSKIDQP